jgi:hypothetical protein
MPTRNRGHAVCAQSGLDRTRLPGLGGDLNRAATAEGAGSAERGRRKCGSGVVVCQFQFCEWNVRAAALRKLPDLPLRWPKMQGGLLAIFAKTRGFRALAGTANAGQLPPNRFLFRARNAELELECVMTPGPIQN